ncbi:carboxypeptidase-like regulatory domain-containing protein [Deinococcus yavapaiensis]|uniref:Carboxypeptidase family protein n=1 Tax=Deinococcus yavapaiensis KR-236 TaxID=694435 RepID=A0A318S5J4_9DEIO|nr:carboxypeptidase-like regulatory domain-containing protein [Deinococcus yavapaiensis]PYE54052.1 carboxypeptidase family protein [Deinococcus yavapaiensis KR-236]
MPMKKMTKTALLSFLTLSVALAAAGKPGTVQGQVVDSHGKPLEGVTVWIKPVVTTGVAEVLTDEKGRYEVSGLPPVGYQAYAWLGVRYQGQKFCYRLALPKTSEYNPFVPKDGVVRNFQWKLSGRLPDWSDDESELGYFGGSLSPLQGGFQDRWATNNDQIELQLTPIGPLIDGSAGQALTKTIPGRKVAVDIPIGTYKVKATFIDKNGQREALVVADDQNGSYGTDATIKFKGASGSCTGGYGGSAGRAYIYWRFK